MLGLGRGEVLLCDHEKEWEENATRTIEKLRNIFGDIAADIEHVGSTAIPGIKAKPIIDIAVSVNNFSDMLTLIPVLGENGFTYRVQSHLPHRLFFTCGSSEPQSDIRTHNIVVVEKSSMERTNYLNFRNYLTAKPDEAARYEAFKLELMHKYPFDPLAYTAAKAEAIVFILRKALAWSYLGKRVDVQIDRPIGATHPKHENLIYPINYGYIDGVIGGDGEELDVYVLGVTAPVMEFSGEVIAVVYRENDNEDKLVAAPIGMSFTAEEIEAAVHFQEQYYISDVEVLEK